MTLLGWLTFLLGSLTDSHSPALLNLFLSSDASICSTMAFPPLGNSDHVVVSVPIDTAYNYSRDEWVGLRDHLRCSMGAYLFFSIITFITIYNLRNTQK